MNTILGTIAIASILFSIHYEQGIQAKMTTGNDKKEAFLAGGCFWGMEHFLGKLDGVIDTDVGFMGGKAKTKVNYYFVQTGMTNYAETVRVVYDSNKLSYRNLIRYFFRIHDPTTLNRQKNDIGKQYRSTVFTNSEEEKRIVKDLIEKIDKGKYFENPIVTTIEPNNGYHKAGEGHQNYLRKNPNGYNCHLLRPDFKFK